jgi:hypothetical protein
MRALTQEIGIEVAEDGLVGIVHVNILRTTSYPLTTTPSR